MTDRILRTPFVASEAHLAVATPLPYLCEAYLGLARVAYQQNGLAEVRKYARLAREIGAMLENTDTSGMASLLEARVELAEGRPEAALAAVDTTAQNFRTRGIEHHDADIADVRIAIHVDAGRLAAAMELARRHHLTDRVAQISLLDGDAAGALEALGTYVQGDGGSSMPTNLVSRTIAAAALWMAGDEQRAVKKLADLFAAVEQESILRSFVDVGPPLRPLLADSDLRARFPALTATLIDALGDSATRDSRAERLSRRELEVLRLIAEGLANRDIGDRLYIALDTVKGHTRKIYEKLGVSRRTEAVARAAELGLL